MNPKRSGEESLEQRGISLTPAVWAQIGELMALEGTSNLREFLRGLVMAGLAEKRRQLSSQLEYENKQLLNRKLRDRQSKTFEAIEDLRAAQNLDEQAIAALARLIQCLTD